MTRKYLIGGNWKCNGSTESVNSLLVPCGCPGSREIVRVSYANASSVSSLSVTIAFPPEPVVDCVGKAVKVLNDGGEFPSNAEVVVAPPAIYVPSVKDNVRADVKVSLQNIARAPKMGAFTGEICAPMAKEFGLEWVITGHSERRVGFGEGGESSQLVAEKTKVALDAGLNVIACIGESLEIREANKTLEVVLEDHMAALLNALAESDWSRVVIAYEPVWAIGTGVTASPSQAQEVHQAIRSWMSEKVSTTVAEDLRIIYGGSVKAANANELATCPDIDGFLVGGASLKPEFIDIIKSVADK